MPTQQTTQPTPLVDHMTAGRKLEVFHDHLQAGNELEIGGRTYVWLDNHITREEMDDQGKMLYFGIDGLALKTTTHNLTTGEKSPHYLGIGDLPISFLHDLVDKLTEEQLLGMTASAALRGMAKKRVLKSESESQKA